MISRLALLLGLLAAIVGCCIIALRSANARTRRMIGTLRSVAKQLGGRFVQADGVVQPSLDFTLAGREAWIEYGTGKDRQDYTRVVVGVRGRSPGQLHVLPDDFGEAFRKVFGSQDLKVGDDAFDAEYVVKARPESIVEAVFRADRRADAIAAVRRLRGLLQPTIDLNRLYLTVQVRMHLFKEDSILRLVKTAEDFIALALHPPLVPMSAGGEAPVSPGSECLVCGTEMRQGLVRCELCRTPHHSECWAYMGRCSTYACKGKRGVE